MYYIPLLRCAGLEGKFAITNIRGDLGGEMSQEILLPVKFQDFFFDSVLPSPFFVTRLPPAYILCALLVGVEQRETF